MMYADSGACQQQLDDIEAIDYFMAHHLSQTLNAPEAEPLFHLLLAVQWALRHGHTCLPLQQVAAQTLWAAPDSDKNGYTFPSEASLKACLATVAVHPDDPSPVVFEHGALYWRRYWQFECHVAEAFKQRMTMVPLTPEAHALASHLLTQLFPAPSTTSALPDWQQVAVANALGRGLSIISGGPGTGKTYTVTRLLALLQAVNQTPLNIFMAAPTGKAAQRLKESITHAKRDLRAQGIDAHIIDAIPEQAMTLHRLLGFRPQSLRLSHDETQPLTCDVLLIDEVSMIDLPMMVRVLRALPKTAKLILLGDAEQLPSVETGSVLADITCPQHPGYTTTVAQHIQALSGQTVPEDPNSRYSHLTLLTHSHRFAGEIAAIAREVISSTHAQHSWSRLQRHEQTQPQFQHPEPGGLSYLPDRLFDTWLAQACTHYFLRLSTAPDLTTAFLALADFRILVPTRIGERGVEQLNTSIEQQLNRQNRHIRPGAHYPGRPVMVRQNSHATSLFNGDVGLIWPDQAGTLWAWFETETDQFRRISLARLPLHETVYAMTIHKTQGSEFLNVALILPRQAHRALSPELIYTGLTRAKQHLYIIGSESVWQAAINARSWRHSGLKRRIDESMPE